MATTTIAFIGLGDMGRWIALHLANKRASETERVVAFDLDSARLKELEAPGLVTTTDPAQLASADILFLCLPDGDVVESALFGEHDIAARLADDAIVVDLSTGAHSKALEIGQKLAAQGKKFIDAPLSGAPAGSKAGTLTIMCGGDPQTFATVRPLLARFGKTILHMGPVGSGQLTKTLNNVIYDINIAALAEVLPVAVAMGLDPETFAKVVTTGTSRSYASEYFVPRMLARAFDEGYPLGKAYKDLVSAAEVAAKGGFPMPVTAAATATYQIVLRAGHGDKDKGAMVLPFEALLGVRFVPSKSDG